MVLLIACLGMLGASAPLASAAAPTAPAVSTGGVKAVQPTTATLTGSVNPHGSATTYHFEYGLTTAYGASIPPTPVGAGTKTVAASAAIGGLAAHTTYHYRLVAVNAFGARNGRDRAFTTLRGPTGVLLGVEPNPILFGGSVTLSGRVLGAGIGGVTVLLQRQDFPYITAFRQVASQTARADGSFSFAVGPLFATTRLRVATKTTIPAASPIATVRNSVLVGSTVGRASHRRVQISGKIIPAVVGARVSLQKLGPSGRWVPIRRAPAAALDTISAQYRFIIPRPSRPGLYRVVVRPDAGSGHSRGTSRERRIRGT